MGKLRLLLLLLLLLVVGGCCSAALAAAQEIRRNDDINSITHVKGFDGPLPFSLETGYVEVEETHGVELFYYFIQSERNPQEDPLILWISGGPGCSSLTALFYEIGPLKFDYAAAEGGDLEGGGGFPRLVYFEDSWTKVSNIIFLDAPVGTGFSYAREAEGLNASFTGTGRQLRIFLHKWLALAQHTEFASNPLYIGGDSYSGITVPVTALEMATHNPAEGEGEELKLNLVGYMVGNGVVDDKYDEGGKIPYMHGMGLISDELYEAALRSCVPVPVPWGSRRNIKRNDARCAKALQAISKVTSDVNVWHILEPVCGDERNIIQLEEKANKLIKLPVPVPVPVGAGAKQKQKQKQEPGPLSLSLSLSLCRAKQYRLSYIWADDADVRETLGIREGSTGSWTRCANLTHFHKDVPSTIPYHRNLTQGGYRALVYNGDHDIKISFVGTQAWIRTLGYPVVAPWRPWYSADHEVAGFTTEYAYNLTFATVKGAGHMAPESRPKECLDMFQKWISPAGRL